MSATENKEIYISFDTTGSMYTILARVRRNAADLVGRLFATDPNIRIGVCTHGDYIDDQRAPWYLYRNHALSNDQRSLMRFITEVGPSGGCGPFAAYEYVLNQARSLNWTDAKSKAIVLIGDEPPHRPHDRQGGNTLNLDWENEATILAKMGVKVYAVQALNKGYARGFYEKLAAMTGGHYLTLDQFDSISEIIEAIGYSQVSPERLAQYEDELISRNRMNRNLDNVFGVLSGRKAETKSKFQTKYNIGGVDLEGVSPGRFQAMAVDADTRIDEFVKNNSIHFVKGKGFYELMKSETIQPYKEIVLEDRLTGDMFTGRKARDIIGLDQDKEVSFTSTRKPWASKYRVFVQSTSLNRKLISGTKFLYEVDANA